MACSWRRGVKGSAVIARRPGNRKGIRAAALTLVGIAGIAAILGTSVIMPFDADTESFVLVYGESELGQIRARISGKGSAWRDLPYAITPAISWPRSYQGVGAEKALM